MKKPKDEAAVTRREALWTTRDTCVVLLNRDFQSDVTALKVVAESVKASGKAPKFVGMMGSKRRIGEVRRALGKSADLLASIEAPVGIEIGAETPHEIAVSILAQIIEARARRLEGLAAPKVAAA